MNVLLIICCYLTLLLILGWCSGRLFRGTSRDFFVASHSIGPFLLLMSVFGTTMTAFALVGSTGKSFERGIGTYGLMASISGLVHMAIFFLIGIRLWALGKRHKYLTQIQFFRARFESDGLGYLLFPILVLLVVPYLLIGIIGAGKVIEPVTAGTFPGLYSSNHTCLGWRRATMVDRSGCMCGGLNLCLSRRLQRGCYSQCISNTRIYGYGNHCVLLCCAITWWIGAGREGTYANQ